MEQYIAQQILKVRDALVDRDLDEAYHQLYTLADPEYRIRANPWEEVERAASTPSTAKAEQQDSQYDLSKDPVNAIRTIILKHCSPEDMVWLKDWLGTYSLPVPDDPWKVEVHSTKSDTEAGREYDDYVTITDGKVELYFDGGVEDNDEQRLCNLLNQLKIKLDYDHAAELMAAEFERMYKESCDEIRKLKDYSLADLAYFKSKLTPEQVKRLDESGLASSTKEGEIAFAEWINKEPYLFGREDYGWYYEIPVDGAGVEHKLIGDTKDLYDLYLQSTNK